MITTDVVIIVQFFRMAMAIALQKADIRAISCSKKPMR